jgi:hypothetical protein
MKWVGYVACMGRMRNKCNVLVGKPSFRPRWDDFRMDRRERGWEDVDWIHVAQVRTTGMLL